MTDSVVYFIRAGDFIKIGTTTDLKSRMQTIRTHCPFDLELLHTIPGSVNTEMRVQSRFRKLHVRGEWFRDDLAIRKYIAAGTDEDVMPEPNEEAQPEYDRELSDWLSRLLSERGITLASIQQLTTIFPRSVVCWAKDKTLRPVPSVSGNLAKVLGMPHRELVSLRERAIATAPPSE